MSERTATTPPLGTCVLFGGCGFIGVHLARVLLERSDVERVVLCDLRAPESDAVSPALEEALRSGRAREVRLDVREPIAHPDLPASADLVVNLAAVHREPGHAPHEYYETNLRGAEHVCAWAAEAGAAQVVFTSSIAPYGPTEAPRLESSLPVPETPYGGSKLAAEYIHKGWQQAGAGRRLVIVRPGVVFGAGEHGNVSRLIHALLRRYFVYLGNRSTIKAGGYVKELCHSLLWALERQAAGGPEVLLYNFSADPPPRLEDYVRAICAAAGVRRRVPQVPRGLLLAVAHAMDAVAAPLGLRHPFSPVRARKTFRSTNVQPGWLREQGYPYRYTLETALQDWRAERPEDWR